MNNYKLTALALALALSGASTTALAESSAKAGSNSNVGTVIDTTVTTDTDALGATGVPGTVGNTNMGSTELETGDQPEYPGANSGDTVDTRPMDNLGAGASQPGMSSTDALGTRTTEDPGTSTTEGLGTAATGNDMETDASDETGEESDTGFTAVQPADELGAGTEDNMSTDADTATSDEMATSANTGTADDMNTTGNTTGNATDPGLGEPGFNEPELGDATPSLEAPDSVEDESWSSDAVTDVDAEAEAGYSD